MPSSITSDSGRMQRRDSSAARRPRLLRATATEPSITTSTAESNALATQPGRRATELLTRMAFVSGSPPDSMLRSTSLLSTRSPMFDSIDRQGDLSSSPVSQASFDDRHPHSYSGRYFSFPSFDLYEASQEDGEKEPSGTKSV
ncbi:uncharacterized protein B0T15DRAFT_392565 [Chaetomium strumarium]|uniref:Uncharacterized protein n=1 Tax=Chaetomium strumarium TaxID=1170767 RepID=A0AAJ0GYX7_9PEZI|nr:hypothetical protein B0T15DRAFT_392565 [Chaetomium strumarium]